MISPFKGGEKILSSLVSLAICPDQMLNMSPLPQGTYGEAQKGIMYSTVDKKSDQPI